MARTMLIGATKDGLAIEGDDAIVAEAVRGRLADCRRVRKGRAGDFVVALLPDFGIAVVTSDYARAFDRTTLDYFGRIAA